MKFISLFSGIGGLDLGLEWAGWECVAQVEKDEYCRRVLAKHWPDVPRFEDVRNVGRDNLPAADAIVGGFPCQPHSYAGQRKGAADDRNLWPDYLRIITELRPAWVVGENVPGLRTSMLDDIISDLEGADYAVQTFDIPAIAFDAKHIRHRLFIVAHSKHNGRAEVQKPEGAGPRTRHGASGQVGTKQPKGPDCCAGGGQAVAHSTSGQRDSGAEVGGEVRTLFGDRGIVNNANGPSTPRPVAHPNGAGQCERRGAEPVPQEQLDAQRGGEGLGHATGAGLPDGTAGTMGKPGAQPQPERPSRAGEFWATEPDVGRVVAGISNRVDRLRGLGNAVVPQVAEFVGRMILESGL